MPKTRALILANRHARKGGRSLRAAIDHLHRARIETISLPEDAAPRLGDAIRAHVGRVDLVVLAGGDGTLKMQGREGLRAPLRRA